MYVVSCEFDSLWFQDHPNEFLHYFDKFGPFHTFLTITKLDISLKVPIIQLSIERT